MLPIPPHQKLSTKQIILRLHFQSVSSTDLYKDSHGEVCINYIIFLSSAIMLVMNKTFEIESMSLNAVSF